jgi:hypothetical protein
VAAEAESAVTTRRALLALLILNGFLLPLSCVPALFAVNTINPMKLSFITQFTVENQTDGMIYVTPVGTASTGRHPLPLCLWQAPWVPITERGRFPIPPGERLTFHYDWDDIRLSELVIETDDGRVRQCDVPLDRTDAHFVIDDPTRLRPVTPPVRAAYDAAQQPVRFWPVVALLSVPAVTFVMLRRWYRRTKTAEVSR